MIIRNIKIENFRLLENVEINLEEITTAVVGKNNSGKTSFSEILHIFMSDKNKFKFEDFSFSTHQIFSDVYNNYLTINSINREEKVIELIQSIPKIRLLLSIEYTEADNWTNIKPFFNTLDTKNEIKILFEYAPKDTIKFLEKIGENIDDINSTVKNIYFNHYQTTIRPYSDIEKTTDLKLSDVQRVLQCHFIEAQRDLEDSKTTNTKLSSIFQKQYDYQTKKEDGSSSELIEATQLANSEIEEKLKDFFKQFISSFQQFGFPGIDKETLELQSNIEIENLFRNNVRLVYNHNGNLLPEKYNGLGYKNLMYIISKILSFQVLHQDKKSDLNLLFIEEPEAHMHPQMQTVFIKNITEFLKGKGFNVQVIITTHSSHILTNAKFDSIRYFAKNIYNTKVKDLKKFHTELNEPKTIEFLEQYLTLDKGELFFSDKAILFEGVVERILMPVFIQKVDLINSLKLSEQYISFIEVGGAYMNKFKDLLEFLEIKTLIITDLDSVEQKVIINKKGNKQTTYQKCEVRRSGKLLTSNVCLKDWLPGKDKIQDLLKLKEKEKISKNVRVAFQTKTKGITYKCGRSFEEAFIIENSQFIFLNKNTIDSIKSNIEQYVTSDEILNYSYSIQDYIDKNKKKTEFAFDLLTQKDNWKVPTYINEGLTWLSQQ